MFPLVRVGAAVSADVVTSTKLFVQCMERIYLVVQGLIRMSTATANLGSKRQNNTRSNWNNTKPRSKPLDCITALPIKTKAISKKCHTTGLSLINHFWCFM